MQGRIWPRLGALSGVLYVALLMGLTSTGSDAQIVIVLELIAILLFLPFLGYLHSVLRRAEGEGAWLVDLTIKLGSIAPGFASRTEGLDPQLHQALEKMNSVAFIVTMLPLGVLMAAVAVVILKTRVLPLWLGLMAAVTAPACLVNGMFLDAEVGPAFLLFLLWVVMASIVLTLRAGRETAKAAASSRAARPEPLR